MKKNLLLVMVAITCSSIIVFHSCRKEPVRGSSTYPVLNTNTPIAISFTEEFDSVYMLTARYWYTVDYSAGRSPSQWSQGADSAVDKSGVAYGFPAYSFHHAKNEYVHSGLYYGGSHYAISSWLISPVLSVKNGDKISFFTRADTGAVCSERLQVLMNSSTSFDVGNRVTSVGGFTTVLLDINATEAINVYPKAWTRYEYVFSGISGSVTTRVAFRRFISAGSPSIGMGIDLFKFEK